MIRPGSPLAALIIAGLVSAPVHGAQTVGAAMGAIDGTVADATGRRLPGVTVVVSGDALMGTLTVVSGPDGTYRFRALPPGEYELSFRLDGFESASRAGIRVGLSETRTVGVVALDVAALREVVTVEGGVRLVDQRRTMIATSFAAEELTRVPGSRSANALLAATPGVQLTRFDVGGSAAIAPGPFSAYGISGYNRPTLEGISVSNMHPLGFNLDYGAFGEVSVGTAAYGPEYPSPGIHITHITKSGGNRYAGSAYTGYEHRRWQAHNIADAGASRAAPGELPPSEANRLHGYHDVNADAGGPVIRDRAWWYVSVRDQAVAARQVLFPYEPMETRVTSTTLKGTMRVSDGHRLVGFWEGSRNRQPIRLDGFLRAATAVNTSVDSTTAQRATGQVWKAEWNALLAGTTYLEVLAGQFVASRAETPNGGGPRFEDRVDPRVAGGNRDWEEDIRRDQLTASVSYFRDGWAGSHHFKVGGDAIRTIDGESWRRAYPGDVLHVRRNGAPSEVYLFESPSRSESGQSWYAVHANDTWQLGARTTVNLGLRFDHLRLFLPAQTHPAGRFNPTVRFASIENVMDWNVLAPRLGVSQALTRDGRTLLKASYGQYWLPTGTELAFNVNPNARVWWRRYLWTDTDADGIWSAGEERTEQGRQGGEAIGALDPGLQLAYVREITLRVEREVASDVRLASGIVWRGERQQGLRQRTAWPIEAFTVERVLEDPGPDGRPDTADDGPDIRLFDVPAELVQVSGVIVRNVRDSEMDYLTWEASAAKRFSRRWSVAASFAHTWNRDHAREYGQTVRANEFPVTPNDYVNTDSRGRHVFRVWSASAYGTYQGPWGLSLSPSVRHQSGQPFGRTLGVTLNSGAIRVLAEPIGTRRQDNVTLVDLRVARDFRVAGIGRLMAFVEVFNVLNSSAAQSVRWETGADFLRPLTIVPPRIGRVGFRLDW